MIQRIQIKRIDIYVNTKLIKFRRKGSSYPGGVKSGKRIGLRESRITHRPPSKKPRRLRCDCGRMAVKVIAVRVGSDPQYIIHLPLCPECLSLERSFLESGSL